MQIIVLEKDTSVSTKWSEILYKGHLESNILFSHRIKEKNINVSIETSGYVASMGRF